jgi:VanZ family protein
VILQRLARIAFGLGALLIIYLSLIPADELPNLGLWDKLEHALAYGLVTVIGGIGWAGRGRAWTLLASGLVALGVVLEILQSFVPGRFTDPGDALANLIGTLFGLAVIAAVGRVGGRVGRLGKGW